MRAAAIIVSGGSGSRMGKPKQFLPLAGSTVAELSLTCFVGMAEVESVVLVLGEDALREHGARLSAVAKVTVVAITTSGRAARMPKTILTRFG